MKPSPMPFRSQLGGMMQEFLHHHRALGKRFLNEERALQLFDHFLFDLGCLSLPEITPTVLERFLASRRRPVAKSYNHLLGVLRRWFEWLVRQQRLSRSPLVLRPRRLTGSRPPFIFDSEQARRLLAVAEALPDNNRGHQRGLVYRTIFALLYGLGLRVGEVARLRLKDLDWDRGVLNILHTKFAKSRLVPFGPKLGTQLREYLRQRGKAWAPSQPDDPLFRFGPEKTRAIHPGTVSQTFRQLVPKLGLSIPDGVAPPRLHCLRHSFAVGTLLRWYRIGVDPRQRLHHLSTFLGHVHPASTVVYLTVTAELLREANERFEKAAAPLVQGVER